VAARTPCSRTPGAVAPVREPGLVAAAHLPGAPQLQVRHSRAAARIRAPCRERDDEQIGPQPAGESHVPRRVEIGIPAVSSTPPADRRATGSRPARRAPAHAEVPGSGPTSPRRRPDPRLPPEHQRAAHAPTATRGAVADRARGRAPASAAARTKASSAVSSTARVHSLSSLERCVAPCASTPSPSRLAHQEPQLRVGRIRAARMRSASSESVGGAGGGGACRTVTRPARYRGMLPCFFGGLRSRW